MEEEGPRINEHFDSIRANLIRCEECNENFFFDFLRHPRYFVTHFKTCHLKNVLYRLNGCSEEENQRVRFGPRRKKDATVWFSQLKSTEKRMISMQDNKWGAIAEWECWSCRLCQHGRKTSDLPHAFEPTESGRRQAFVHLRQVHEAEYTAFLSLLPAVETSARFQSSEIPIIITPPMLTMDQGLSSEVRNSSSRKPISEKYKPLPSMVTRGQSIEADRSRLRRMRATPEAKKAEAERSRRRREQLTPAQRQVDAERRVRKRQRGQERDRSRVRRSRLNSEAREREVVRSRERRQNATEQQRNREAQRSRRRRQQATEEQRLRERERCRRRYETQKLQKVGARKAGAMAEGETRQSTSSTLAFDTTTAVDESDQTMPLPRTRVMPKNLEQRNRLLLQQQAGLGLQIRSLYASLSRPPSSQIEL